MKWNAIYVDKSVKEPLRTRTVAKMIDKILRFEKDEDSIHDHNPDKIIYNEDRRLKK